MSLPVGQQRKLDAIAAILQSTEPRLAAMFAMFARLTRDEAAPRCEQLPARRWYYVALQFPAGVLSLLADRRGRTSGRRAGKRLWLRTLIVCQVAMAAVACAVLLGMNSRAGPACGPPAAVRMAHHAQRTVAAGQACPLLAGRVGR